MAPVDRTGEAFLQALEQARRGEQAMIESWPEPSRPEAHVSVSLSTDRGGGGEARWVWAMQWTDGLPAAPARPPSGQSDGSRAESATAIAEELGLGTVLTQRQLAQRWRDFIWRNHPDRQPEEAREGADARVAIANALYDEARRILAKRRS
jgi:hypothetical protein